MREIFLGMLGLCMGTTIASGVVAFIISLGIVPRFARDYRKCRTGTSV